MAGSRSRRPPRKSLLATEEPGDTTTLGVSGPSPPTDPSGSDPGEPGIEVFQRGAWLGRYVILGGLGSGGMGSVYAAYDPELDRRVAIKVLRGDLLSSETRRESQARLLREAQATARLAHPNVVTVHDVGIVGERLFIAMELIEGQTLAEWLRAEDRPWHEVLDTLLEAGKGLKAAHEVGLVHRDFKPGNVIVSTDGRVRIFDFGLVRGAGIGEDPVPGVSAGGGDAGAPPPDTPVRPSPTSRLTAPGKALGTPAYMAPEQRTGEPADSRADQFSYCVTLYEALYHELPFDDENGGTANGRVRDVPPSSRVPGWLRGVLLRGLEADPAKRHPSMDALLSALRRESLARRRRWQRSALALLAVAALGSGLVAFDRHRERPCQAAEQRLDGVWDPSRKAVIQAAFGTSGLGYADGAWWGLERALDSYTRGWVAMHTEACEATHLRGEQSGLLLDRRMACLDGHLTAFEAFVGILEQADAGVIERAVSAADELGSLAACADRRALTSLLPPPRDEETVQRIETVRAKIAEAKLHEDLGRYPDLLATARAAFEEAERVPYRPLHGEARVILARGLGRSGRAAEMRERLLEAVRIAHATRHHELLAEAFSGLIIAEYLLGDAEAARVWGSIAGGAIEALEGRDDLEARRLRYLGVAVSLENEHEESIAYFERSLEHLPEINSTLTSVLLNNLGVSSLALGRFDEAEDYLLRSVENSERVFGHHHLYVAIPLTSLGDLYRGRGEHHLALDRYRHSLRLKEAALGPSHRQLVKTLMGVGWSSLELGEARAAVGALERAVELGETHPGDPRELAMSRFLLARALWDTEHDRRLARTLAEQALRDLRPLGERANESTTMVKAWLEARG